VSSADTVTPPWNVLLEELDEVRVAPPCVLVVFGASGDLFARKLLLALERLAERGALPGAFSVVGVARRHFDDEGFAGFARAAVPAHSNGDHDCQVWAALTSGFRYVSGRFDEDATYRRLALVLGEIDRTRATGGSRVFYLATPPNEFPTVIRGLGRAGLDEPPPGAEGAFARIVIEKPYGRDLRSAQRLDDAVHSVFREEQVYRIDHFLGKETVQNILALRFANAIFEPLWSRSAVDSIQVTVAEPDGVGHRADFYDQVGAVRDVVQNHVMQLLALTLMEPPSSTDPESIRDEKVKVLRAISLSSADDPARSIARGQYAEGWVDGVRVPGYREEPGVPPFSNTETCVALRLQAGNWRWAGVPIYARAGKRWPKKLTEIAIQFKDAPDVPFRREQKRSLEPNTLVVQIQPDEGVTLLYGAKVPGHRFDVSSVAMEFLYQQSFSRRTQDAYERLLIDVMVGDATLFIRSDEVMESWRIITPVQLALSDQQLPLTFHPAGSWGPPEVDALIERDGRRWRRL
jgi:glucose-6-phosphate 1-dehydrogenase